VSEKKKDLLIDGCGYKIFKNDVFLALACYSEENETFSYTVTDNSKVFYKKSEIDEWELYSLF
jgi:hypothetical protein